MLEEFNLKGKTAIITGASGGLGESMAIALSKHGCKIAIFDIKNGQKVVKKIKTKSKFYKVDVNSEKSIKQQVKKVKKEFNSIDILINNAGVFYPTPVEKTTKEQWDKLMNINLRGYFLMTKYTVPFMKKGGRIINISSVAGHHAFANSAAYNSSKGAIIQLTKTLALDLAKKGINVNAICPGIFVTPMTKDLLKSKQMKQTMKNSVPKARAGKAEELGGLIVYLASDASEYMTGSIISIDGGWTCHL
jgi:NAD(P)-dependent dehydrogenase (short-subunit alcohol dehydrogenase family)